MPQIILMVENNDDELYLSDKISCYILSDGLSSTLFNKAVATGKMVLAIGPNALTKCKELHLDGVVKEIDTSKPVKAQIKSLREKLSNQTLGVIIPAHRHEAMLAGEVEPEFIAFYSSDPKKDMEVVSWYNELFLIPLAWMSGNSQTEISDLDTDFVIIKAKNFKNFGC